MTKRNFFFAALAALGGLVGWRLLMAGTGDKTAEKFEVEKSEDEWQKALTPRQFHVLRQQGTERAGSSPLDGEHRKGVFSCAACDLPLFSSDAKFDSGTGWPSFWQPLENAVGTSIDDGIFGRRVEVHCRRCGGHLGHVFPDGPPPTNLRYCMNGVAMKFKPAAGA